MVKNSAGKIVSFHVRYRVNELQPDGTVKRALKSHKLADRDEKHFSVSCKTVQDKCDEFMKGLNAWWCRPEVEVGNARCCRDL